MTEQLGLFAPTPGKPSPRGQAGLCGCGGRPRPGTPILPWTPLTCPACEAVTTWDPPLSALEAQEVMRGRPPGRWPVAVGTRPIRYRSKTLAPVVPAALAPERPGASAAPRSPAGSEDATGPDPGGFPEGWREAVRRSREAGERLGVQAASRERASREAQERSGRGPERSGSPAGEPVKSAKESSAPLPRNSRALPERRRASRGEALIPSEETREGVPERRRASSGEGYAVTRPGYEGLARVATCPDCSLESNQVLDGVGSWVTCPGCRVVFLIHAQTTDPDPFEGLEPA